MKNKNPIVMQLLHVIIGQVICAGLMLGVFALINKFDLSVLFGGIVGTVLAIGNFFFMVVGLLNLTDGSDVTKVKLFTQVSFMIRTAAVFGLAVVAIKFGKCNAIATLLPLLFPRVVLGVEQFILKMRKEDKSDGN